MKLKILGLSMAILTLVFGKEEGKMYETNMDIEAKVAARYNGGIKIDVGDGGINLEIPNVDITTLESGEVQSKILEPIKISKGNGGNFPKDKNISFKIVDKNNQKGYLLPEKVSEEGDIKIDSNLSIKITGISKDGKQEDIYLNYSNGNEEITGKTIRGEEVNIVVGMEISNDELISTTTDQRKYNYTNTSTLEIKVTD